MPRIGYARVSSAGQSLEVQLEKLGQAQCDRIYQEKRSGRTAERPEFQACMNYLREGDTLIVTRLDRLARSVVHLAELTKRFQREQIDLRVLDQNIDTGTSTGRLLFNMLACIAEFENDLRTERQAEGIAKARENGVRFGRPLKLTEAKKQDIQAKRQAGASIGQLVQEFRLGEASIYRALAAMQQADTPPTTRTTRIILWLRVENNSKFVRGKGKSRQFIEEYHLSHYQAQKLAKDGWEYELTFHYEDDKDLESQIYGLVEDMGREAELRNGFIEYDFSEVGTDRSWG